MTCLECSQLDLKSHPNHANVGFGKCRLEKLKGVFVSFGYSRDCQQFRPAQPEIVAKRHAWQNKEK